MARILVVDDDRQVRDMCRSMLQRNGHEVEVAPDGHTALAVFRENPADLVVTDIAMAGGSGYDTIRGLRSDFPDVPIIAVTGGGVLGREPYLEVAERLGAVRTLCKPFGHRDFLEAVDQALHDQQPAAACVGPMRASVTGTQFVL